jgi:hypothetical protein
MVDKIELLKFLRDTQRICWLEIYLKLFASTLDPFLCTECDTYFTLSQAATCYYHTANSEKNLQTKRRKFPCCESEYHWTDFYQERLHPHGCQTRFHTISAKGLKANPIFEELIPLRYQIVKDDLPGHPYNQRKHDFLTDDQQKEIDPISQLWTMPILKDGKKYMIPMSLNAEVCISQFVNKEKPVLKRANSGGVPSSSISAREGTGIFSEGQDSSDLLYDVYHEAWQSVKRKVKIKRMKSAGRSPGRSPGRHKSPPRGLVVVSQNANSGATMEDLPNLKSVAAAAAA